MTDKTDKNESFEEFVFEDWLRDGLKGMRGKFGHGKRFDTSDFYAHIRNAQKEQLMAVRSLIDSAIDFLDREEAKAEKKA